ncbi:MAG TPA: polyprenol monophosphomannose synthase [Terriglobales bacterium]|nr:polyprenol monophosphomannose synthase [Terriglobales bacterium]
MASTQTGRQVLEAAPRTRVSFSLVLPTLNEAANIERMVRTMDRVLRTAGTPDFEIIVVDDNSPDGTGQIADRLASEMPGRVRVVHRIGKASLGTAAVAGWDTAESDILALMDADFQHPPELMPRLIQAIRDGADIAVGSRYAEGGAMSEEWSLARKLISGFGTVVVKLLLGSSLKRVRDPFSGCFAMRRNVIADKHLHPEGFKVLMEVLAVGDYSSVCEVPYEFSARTAGQSKLRLRVAIDDFLLLVRLAWQTRRKRAN